MVLTARRYGIPGRAHNEARRDVKGEFAVVVGGALVLVVALANSVEGALVSGSRVVGGGGFGARLGRDIAEFGESRS